MRSAYRGCPAIHCLLEPGGNSALHLVIDLLVHTRYRHKKRRTNFPQHTRQVIDKRTIGNCDAAIEFGKVDVARRDVREREKADRDVVACLEVEFVKRN